MTTDNEIDVREGLPEVLFVDTDGIQKKGHYFGKQNSVNHDSGHPVTAIMVISPSGHIISRAPSSIRFTKNKSGFEFIEDEPKKKGRYEDEDED